MDKGAWQATVHGVTKNLIQLSTDTLMTYVGSLSLSQSLPSPTNSFPFSSLPVKSERGLPNYLAPSLEPWVPLPTLPPYDFTQVFLRPQPQCPHVSDTGDSILC